MGKKKDLKEGLSSARKADITHIRTPMLVYGARACEYGDAKYERANYARSMETTREDFQRLRAYLRATVSHVIATLDSMEYHQANDPNLEDVDGMKGAAYARDTDAKPGQAVGASGLPHLCGAVASLNMAITQATRSGLLPEDPGRPWEDPVVSGHIPEPRFKHVNDPFVGMVGEKTGENTYTYPGPTVSTCSVAGSQEYWCAKCDVFGSTLTECQPVSSDCSICDACGEYYDSKDLRTIATPSLAGVVICTNCDSRKAATTEEEAFEMLQRILRTCSIEGCDRRPQTANTDRCVHHSATWFL